MTDSMTDPNLAVYMDEYTRDDIIARYISDSAGAGIAYVLNHVYGPIYSEIIERLIASRPPGHRFRILEFGCGGGMNLLKIVELFRRQNARIEKAYGTDFSAPMIRAAEREASAHLPRELRDLVQYVVAGNERLSFDLAQGVGVTQSELFQSFDLLVGVNTFRYCHRLKKENESAKDMFNLSRPGGYLVNIDMNAKFPFFKSKLRRREVKDPMETFIPSLKEYAQPFQRAGFTIVESRNFCWIPHSAPRHLLPVYRALTPVLNLIAPDFATRSMVIARRD